jgi:NAD(P)-dependent dehydrogenase (short-subunit alcohol dehydrogenase family)
MVAPETVEETIDVNLLGVWRTARATLPHVVERKGQIVVIASVYAFMNGILLAPYAIAKAGVEQLGRALRAELVPHGASASVAYFGFIDTEMVRDGLDDPVVEAAEDALPKFARKRLPPSAAARGIVRGIERRSPRIIRPRWWAVPSVLRGVMNPLLDRFMARDERVLDAIRAADDEHRITGAKIVAGGDRG